jgi:putative transposase
LSLRMVEEMLAARGISVTHETIRQWGLKFGRKIRRPDPSASASPWRQMAPRRGRRQHRREEALAVACRRRRAAPSRRAELMLRLRPAHRPVSIELAA